MKFTEHKVTKKTGKATITNLEHHEYYVKFLNGKSKFEAGEKCLRVKGDKVYWEGKEHKTFDVSEIPEVEGKFYLVNQKIADAFPHRKDFLFFAGTTKADDYLFPCHY